MLPLVGIFNVTHQGRWGGGVAGEVNFEFLFAVLDPLLSFKMTHRLSKLIKAFQILQLKKDQKFLLFSLLFSECFYLYLRMSTGSPFRCAVSHIS